MRDFITFIMEGYLATLRVEVVNQSISIGLPCLFACLPAYFINLRLAGRCQESFLSVTTRESSNLFVPFVYPGEVCGPALLGSAEEMVPIRKWEESKEQIMSKDKCSSIFSRHKKAILLIILQIFFATLAVLKFTEYGAEFSSFGWGIFSHVTCLDQLRTSENI